MKPARTTLTHNTLNRLLSTPRWRSIVKHPPSSKDSPRLCISASNRTTVSKALTNIGDTVQVRWLSKYQHRLDCECYSTLDRYRGHVNSPFNVLHIERSSEWRKEKLFQASMFLQEEAHNRVSSVRHIFHILRCDLTFPSNLQYSIATFCP